MKADVTKEADITAAVKKIVDEAGGLHGMVANAGITNHKAALDFTTEEIERLFSINVCFSVMSLFICVPLPPAAEGNWMVEEYSKIGQVILIQIAKRSYLVRFTQLELLRNTSSSLGLEVQL